MPAHSLHRIIDLRVRFCSVECVKKSCFVMSNVLSSHGLFCQMCKEALFFPPVKCVQKSGFVL